MAPLDIILLPLEGVLQVVADFHWRSNDPAHQRTQRTTLALVAGGLLSLAAGGFLLKAPVAAVPLFVIAYLLFAGAGYISNPFKSRSTADASADSPATQADRPE